ncbi:hypothetical protein NF556_07410 [Ornithinimicrobium faecis]|uniref:NHL repeat-containing protein n=1 Tax=Ornithinimicrobium faecis TaxID=2934158 RepID=A0ABY4YYP8_9MICO|nr:hypothetical protein [Ornithinimicrobium sp. HY1793]USQ81468.1 hypothetical protein NF556_07410 [Ornithinimicrobium sp. HY1793]
MTTSDTAPQRAHRALFLAVIAALVTALAALAMAPTTASPTSRPAANDSATESATGPATDGSATEPDPMVEPEPVAGEVVRIAGESDPVVGDYSGDNGPAVDARLGDSLDVAEAPDGTTYVADWQNERLRAIDPDGTISTVAHNGPLSVDVDASGSVVVGGLDGITRVAADGETVVVASRGKDDLPPPGASAPAESIDVGQPTDVAAGADGTVYAITSQRSRIIRVDPDGALRVLAGGGDLDPADADGSRPATDYAMGPTLALAVADTGTFAGTVFFATEHGGQVMSIGPDGSLDIAVGTGEIGFSGDGGPARDATLSRWVKGLAISPRGDLLIADTDNRAVRRVDASGVITTVHGGLTGMERLDVGEGGIVFARGAQVQKVVGDPESVATEPLVEPSGVDPFANQSAGEVVHLAGADGETPAPPPDEIGPTWPHVTVDADGSVLVGDPDAATVHRVEADGSTSPVAGVWPVPDDVAPDPTGSESVVATEHAFKTLTDLATRPDGTVLIAEQDKVWELREDGTMTRLELEGEELGVIQGIATDDTGALYLAVDNLVRRVAPNGTLQTVGGGGEREGDAAEDHPATEASLGNLKDVAVDSEGNIYLIESQTDQVRRISADGVLTTVLGTSQPGPNLGGFSGDGGPGGEAELNTPTALLIGPDDEVYVADTYNARVRRLDPDGTVTTVAGNGLLPGEDDATGPAADTPLGEPTSLALDGEGDLVIAASRPARIHKVTSEGTLESVTEVAAPGVPDEETPAAEVVLPGAVDVAVGPDGAPRVTAEDGGVWTVGESLSRSTTSASWIASGDRTYARTSEGVSRLLPDGRSVLVAGGGSRLPDSEPAPALTLDLGLVEDVAAGPEDSVFVLSSPAEGRGSVVNHVTAHGSATAVLLGSTEHLLAITTAPDGTLYGLDADTRNVVRLGGETDPTTIVTRDEDTTKDLAKEPFGAASALPPSSLLDLAAGPDGTLFAVSSEGLLVVDPQEDTYAFLDGPWDEEQNSTRVAADRHGNAYVLSH